jgi:type IV pilus assembly protein PilA
MNRTKTYGILRNEKGLTLVELLAVIVIIGILAAIAVPSVSGLITKSKHQAHRANAQMIVDAARMKVVAEDLASTAITLKELHQGGYLEKIPEDPENKGNTYHPDESVVDVVKSTSGGTVSYSYTITLKGNRDGGSLVAYFNGVSEEQIKSEPINTGSSGSTSN